MSTGLTTRRPAGRGARGQGATPVGGRRALLPGRPPRRGRPDRGGPRRGPRGRGRAAGRRGLGRVLLTWLALVGVLAAGLVFLFFYSAAFVVKDIQVSGGRPEVQDQVMSSAQIPYGRPLARVSEAGVTQRVLDGDPRVASVSVERDWPSTVRYTITEREPVIALRGAAQTWVADAQGVVYERTSSPSRRLPLVEVRALPTDLTPAAVSGLAELWRLRPDPALLKGDLTAPRVAADGTVTMRVQDVRLRWGQPVDNAKKWQVVQAILGQEAVDPQSGQRLVVDVSIPDTPVVTGLPAAAPTG